ncbi:hypothetical protein [uncultured Dialister sp.]|uniref:hypothetical protein n=1 Tax=uncultured Dialister sp. TaxID=278064 RepID=UPI0026DBCB73|nr:hypothetical protein [uncultured Dialister sp.]
MEKEMTTMCNLSLNISEEAMNEGLQKGIKIGEDSALNRTAIRLLTMGFSVDDVAKGTGLSIETVEKLKESMEQKG